MSIATLKKIIRVFRTNKLSFALNSIGLAIGITSFIILALWIYKERNYNTFLEDKQVYQVVTNYTVNGKIKSARATSLPLIRSLAQDIPGIKTVAYTLAMDDVNLQAGSQVSTAAGRYSSPDIFTVFPRSFVLGTPTAALNDPAGVVISSDLAEKLYGRNWRKEMMTNSRPVSIGNKELMVKGVFESFPENSTFRSDFFLSMPKDENEHIGSFNYDAYLKLEQHTNTANVIAAVNRKIAKLTSSTLYLQQFRDIHLYSGFSNGKAEGGRILYVRLFSIAALFLLAMACINFMNLNIAGSFKRTKELSVKRMMGAGRASLVLQLVGEAYLIVLLAISIALVMTYLLLPYINTYLSENLSFPLRSYGFWLFIAGLLVTTGLMASIYPAMVLTSFNPLNVLKRQQGMKLGGIGITKVLFTLQFFISVLLICTAYVTNSQVQYLRHKDLGYNRKDIIGKKLSKEEMEKISLLKQDLETKNIFASHTFSSSNLVTGTPMVGDVKWNGKTPADSVRFAVLYSDKDFVKTFKVKMLTGSFGANLGADLPVVINQKAADMMGGDLNVLGKTINVLGSDCRVTGIVKDFNFHSLHSTIEPLIIADYPAEAEYIFARPLPGREADAVAYMDALTRNDHSGKAHNYFWVENTLDTLYRDEANLGKRSFLFSAVCIVIALLGFVGLVNYSIVKRLRELGIRRVFGSARHQIALLIFGDFLKWISVATIIAVPIAYLFMHNWLEKFPYRIALNVASFIVPLFAMATIILLVVLFYTFRIGKLNPASVLRDE